VTATEEVHILQPSLGANFGILRPVTSCESNFPCSLVS